MNDYQIEQIKIEDIVTVSPFMTYRDTISNCRVGIVIAKQEDTGYIGVEFPEDVGGHDCSSRGKWGHCWWFEMSEIKEVISHEIKNLVKKDDNKMSNYDYDNIINKYNDIEKEKLRNKRNIQITNILIKEDPIFLQLKDLQVSLEEVNIINIDNYIHRVLSKPKKEIKSIHEVISLYAKDIVKLGQRCETAKLYIENVEDYNTAMSVLDKFEIKLDYNYCINDYASDDFYSNCSRAINNIIGDGIFFCNNNTCIY